ncbi:uncharacterized protein LOC135205002 [Macrobrachium nipponense]|uniref:uncharacterized protein LOC135205002 n=1 Tax=Macrobrachium nipponense TaxID=159736 RepID=UPI0030C8549E
MSDIWIHYIVFSMAVGWVLVKAKSGTGLYTGPYFPSPKPQNITVHQNTIAYLPCSVKQLGDKSVSWVRQRDADILTVDRYTFVRDERLSVHYIPDTETWTLVITYVQERDAGTYECQISTEPKMSMLVHLNVIVPQVEVVGAVDKYVRKGSTATMECIVSSTVQLPDYIFWYHSGKRLLEYDHPRVKFSVSKKGVKGAEMSITSSLEITDAVSSDEGNYTCLPSNLPAATTILHVLNDEHPAAMQTGAAMLTDPPSPHGILAIVILAFIFVHIPLEFQAFGGWNPAFQAQEKTSKTRLPKPSRSKKKRARSFDEIGPQLLRDFPEGGPLKRFQEHLKGFPESAPATAGTEVNERARSFARTGPQSLRGLPEDAQPKTFQKHLKGFPESVPATGMEVNATHGRLLQNDCSLTVVLYGRNKILNCLVCRSNKSHRVALSLKT